MRRDGRFEFAREFPAFLTAILTVALLAACGNSSDGTSETRPTVFTEVRVGLNEVRATDSFVFEPADFTFDIGETVRFVLSSKQEFHTFTMRELGVDVAVNARETRDLWYTFDQLGVFELVCIPHEQLGMIGTVTVR